MHRRNMLAGVTSLLGLNASAAAAGRDLGGPRSAYGARAASEQGTRFFNPSATPGTGASRTPLQDSVGIITPSSLHFERHHAGVPPLAGGIGSLSGAAPLLTVGSYWPYATTLWDYTRRAMPYPNPGSLTSQQVYAVTAYVLYLNGIVAEDSVLDQIVLPAIRMPNRDGFIADPRSRRKGE